MPTTGWCMSRYFESFVREIMPNCLGDKNYTYHGHKVAEMKIWKLSVNRLDKVCG